MKVKRFNQVNDLVLELLTPAHESRQVAWQDIFEAIVTVKKEAPNALFRTPPLMYCDLEERTIGFLFADSSSDTVFYVFR